MMKATTDILFDLASLEHYPADFDSFFFDEIAERLMLLDPSFEIRSLLEFVNANTQLNQPTILWNVVLGVLKRLEDKHQVVELFHEEWRRWLELSAGCSCMKKLFYELATQLVNNKSLNNNVVQEISSAAVSTILAEQTNIDLRRCLSVFSTAVLNNYEELDQTVAKPLLCGFHQADHSMVIDAVSHVFVNSRYLQRMTDAEKLAIHERLKGMKRPGLVYMQFAAQVYQTTPEKIASRLDEEFVTDKVPALVAFEILKLEDPTLPKEMLLKFIASHTSETVDNLVDCVEDLEEAFPQDVDRTRSEIIAAIPNPRHCSAQSLTKFLNYLRLNDGVTSKVFTQAFIAAKTRIQREPDLLDTFLVDSDDLAALMQETTIQRIFHELTIDVIMAERSFNWVHTDSAIAILDRIADYFYYDEDLTHDKISKLVNENDDDLGYVSLTASKFLFNHAPEYVLKIADDLFVLNPNFDLRSTILNRLLLCSDSELPSKVALQRILDDVIQLESNEQLQEKGLRLAEKLSTNDSDYRSRYDDLKKLVEMQEERRQRSKISDIEDLVQIVEAAKINSDCYTAEVSKECY